MTDQFQEQLDILKATSQESGNATGALRVSTITARAMEIWLLVTAVASGTLILIIETSIDGVNYVEQDRIAAVTTVASFTAVINRADEALGTDMRVRWEVSGGTIDFEVKAGRME